MKYLGIFIVFVALFFGCCSTEELVEYEIKNERFPGSYKARHLKKPINFEDKKEWYYQNTYGIYNEFLFKNSIPSSVELRGHKIPKGYQNFELQYYSDGALKSLTSYKRRIREITSFSKKGELIKYTFEVDSTFYHIHFTEDTIYEVGEFFFDDSNLNSEDTVYVDEDINFKFFIANPPFSETEAYLHVMNEDNVLIERIELPIIANGISFSKRYYQPGLDRLVFYIKNNDWKQEVHEIRIDYKIVVFARN